MNDGRGFRRAHPVAMNGDPTGNVLLNDGRGCGRGHPVAMNGAPTGNVLLNDGRGFRRGRPVAMNGAPTGNVLLNDGRGFRRGRPLAMNGAPTGLCTFVGCVFIRTWGCARQPVNLQPSPKPDKGWDTGPWSKASHAMDGVCRAIRDETASLRSGPVFHPESAKTTDTVVSLRSAQTSFGGSHPLLRQTKKNLLFAKQVS